MRIGCDETSGSRRRRAPGIGGAATRSSTTRGYALPLHRAHKKVPHLGPDGERVEIQIRTEDMHHVAEVGIAAHWLYKEDQGLDETTGKTFAWIQDLVENHIGIVTVSDCEVLRAERF